MKTLSWCAKTKVKLKLIKPALLLAVLLAVFALVSQSDFEQEMRAEAHYKEMVCSGAWGNYKNIEVVCKEVGKLKLNHTKSLQCTSLILLLIAH